MGLIIKGLRKFGDVRNMLIILLVLMVLLAYNSLSKSTTLYSVNMCSLLYATCTSVRLLQKETKAHPRVACISVREDGNKYLEQGLLRLLRT